MNKFYVYAWYNIDTKEVFYIGKGTGKRYKNTTQRNEKFKEYIKNNNVDVIILKDNLTEEEAFKYEIEYTEKYKAINQCSCNLANPGLGGVQNVWTNEMREYWSEYNPMKSEAQRERMRNNNPMKDKEVAMRNGKKHKKAIIIGDKYFEGIVDAEKYYNRSGSTIGTWLKKGVNPQGEKCCYVDEKRKVKGTPVLIDGIYYDSISDAAEAINVSPTNLGIALRNKKQCKKHICEYANQQPSQ